MLDNIFGPYSDVGLLILRIGLGAVFLAHGLPKINRNSPVGGLSGVGSFFKQMGIPLPGFFALVVALLETVGAILLVLGLGTRILALGFAIDMLVATWLVRIRMAKSPFSGGQGIGWEFEFALMMGSLALLFTGAGGLGLDPIVGFSQLGIDDGRLRLNG